MRFAPFIINKKHKSTKIDEKKLKFINGIKKGISKLKILIGKKYIKVNNETIIINNLIDG